MSSYKQILIVSSLAAFCFLTACGSPSTPDTLTIYRDSSLAFKSTCGRQTWVLHDANRVQAIYQHVRNRPLDFGGSKMVTDSAHTYLFTNGGTTILTGYEGTALENSLDLTPSPRSGKNNFARITYDPLITAITNDSHLAKPDTVIDCSAIHG